MQWSGTNLAASVYIYNFFGFDGVNPNTCELDRIENLVNKQFYHTRFATDKKKADSNICGVVFFLQNIGPKPQSVMLVISHAWTLAVSAVSIVILVSFN
jgi:hypothetical protein